jgi:hypothetical protein
MEEMTTQPTAEQLTHDEAIDAICGCAATVTVLSYQEAIESYLDLRGIDPDAIQATEARMSSAERERCARIVERRVEARFNEHGTREWDTNATYYQGDMAEIYEALDEEADEIAATIRSQSNA